MRNKKYLVFLLLLSLSFYVNVNAKTIYKVKVTGVGVNLREGPGTSYGYIRTLAENGTYTLAEENLVKDEKGCSTGWFKIYYSGTDIGYFCGNYGEKYTEEEAEFVPSSECETSLSNLGFPKSYWKGLCEIKSKHPNWTFEADKNGLVFSSAVSSESLVSKSLIQTTYQGYLSTDSQVYDYGTDKFKVREGSNWYAASSEVVAYYLDPRNFLSEESIFMFEKLSFDSSYQNVDAIKAILNSRDIVEYADTIYNAARDNNVNAIYLASKIRQETGGNYSNYSLHGNSVTINGTVYSHVYNPYNIGANTGAGDGLYWAVNGTSYLRPWTTLATAISGGAKFISNDYISKGQDTIYFQKFNTSSYSSYNSYAHQYMTNVKGATSEASIAYNGYAKEGLLDKTAFKFVIPVYENMADSYNLPNTGNPNNHLSNILINNIGIPSFNHGTFTYNYYVATGVNEVNVSAKTINTNATVLGTGNIKLTSNNTSVVITVTAQNKAQQKYTINIIKTDGKEISLNDLITSATLPESSGMLMFNAGYTAQALSDKVKSISSSANVTVNGKTSGNLVTGDIVNIVNGSESKSYPIVIKGDPTGDGNINIQDLLRVQKYILGYTKMDGAYLKAGDTNQDGIVNVVDLLRIQKHILGYITIK